MPLAPVLMVAAAFAAASCSAASSRVSERGSRGPGFFDNNNDNEAPIALAAPASRHSAASRASPFSSQSQSGKPPSLVSVHCTAPPKALALALLATTNRARARARTCGAVNMPKAPPLYLDSALSDVARGHARDMATNDFFAHQGSDATRVGERAQAAGYLYRQLGENLAAGYGELDEVQAGWLSSPSHCETLMRQGYTQLGVACEISEGTDYEHYWVVVFGRER